MANDLDARTKLRVALTYCGYKCRELYQWYRSAYVTVETAAGAVRGVAVHSEFGQRYAQFTGVPYAQPPLGDLRFRVRILLIRCAHARIDEPTTRRADFGRAAER